MNVLLLGDSIRMGYQSYVRDMMMASVVDYPADNGRYSTQFLYYIPHWKYELGNKNYDIVHFNTGLWDIVRLENESEGCFIPLDTYLSNMKRIVARLRYYFPEAELIFATTTSVMEPCEVYTEGGVIGRRFNTDIVTYNMAASKLLSKMDIGIDDLYLTSLELYENRIDKTHFSDEGYRKIAMTVVENLEKMLK